MGQVFGWVVGANVFVLTTISLVFVVLPWLAGHQPELDASTIVTAGATGVALMVGFLFVAFRRHQRKGLATPAARLVLADDRAELKLGQTSHRCAREDLVLRPVHAHETLRGVDYYMGPALELRIDDDSWVIAVMDGKHRWGHDPPAVQQINWICSNTTWNELLAAEDLQDMLVAYQS